ncbi:MAG TPA: ABC transporter ATP-binding protein, partial [Planctomycetota bacterium]|nr:ABC transporter ATP-binding protein [Planctomycetota bacterium]
TKIVAFESPGAPPRSFAGGYTDYKEKKRAEERERKAADEARKAQEKPREKPRPKAPGPAKKKRRTLEEVEARILELEEKRTTLHAELASEAIYKDVMKLKEKQGELAALEEELRGLEEEWEAYASE